MADISVSVAAPGAQEGAKGLDQFATAASKAAVASDKASAAAKILSGNTATMAANHARSVRGIAGNTNAPSAAVGLSKGGRIADNLLGLNLDGMTKAMATVEIGKLAISKTMETLNTVLQINLDKYSAAAEGALEMAHAMIDAKEILGRSALDIASRDGDAIKTIIANGSQGALEAAKYNEAHGMRGAVAATAELMTAGYDTRKADAAAREAQALGIPYDKAVHIAVTGGMTKTSQILTEAQGRRVTDDDVKAMQSRVSSAAITKALDAIEKNQGQTNAGLIDKIPTEGVAQSYKDKITALDPYTEIMKMKYNQDRERLDVLKTIETHMTSIDKFIDFFKGVDSVNNKIKDGDINLNSKYNQAEN